MKNECASEVRFASGMNALLGVWLIIAPWIFGFIMDSMSSMLNSMIVGLAIVILAGLRCVRPHKAPSLSWINLALGIWIFVSPRVYSYADNWGGLWNSVIVGAAIFAFALLSGSITVSERQYRRA